MGKTEITLTQQAYICGYEGAFLRYIEQDGTKMAHGIWGNWYEAQAEDENGNEYQVYWKLRDDFNPDEDQDEGNACEWDNPYMVIDENGKNVKESVILANDGMVIG